MSLDLEVRMKRILCDHFESMLRDEWKESFSIFEIGARGEDGIDEVVVWVRTSKILDHTAGLMVPNKPMMIVDPIDRAGTDGQPRRKEDTVLVRLFKPIKTSDDGEVDLMVELFQVFGDLDEAEETFSRLTKVATVNVGLS